MTKQNHPSLPFILLINLMQQQKCNCRNRCLYQIRKLFFEIKFLLQYCQMKSTIKIFSSFILTALVFIAYSCSHHPYSSSNKLYKAQAKQYAKTIREEPTNEQLDSIQPTPYWIGTTNFNLRKPNFVIIHHTAQNACDETLKTFTMVKTQVSAHYVICKDGTVHHMLNDYLRAWQAGVSKWGSLVDINSSSVGIELDNNGFEPFPNAQINSLLHLLATLKSKYN